MEKIRFGILGCGNIAARFAKALNKSEDAELYASAARSAEKAEKFAETHGGKAYAGYEDLLADPEVQAVYIATVHTTHAELAKMAIEAGKPVICEKPFFTNGKEAKEVIELAKAKNVLIMEAFWTRTQPAYKKMMEWIREGKIGELRMIRAAFCFAMPYMDALKEHRLWNPELGGGALLDAGVYPYEYVTGIMGCPPKELQTMVDWAPTGVDRTVTMNMKFENGVIADCLTSIGGYMDSESVISGTGGYIKQYYFLGSRKTELYQGREGLVETYEDPEEEGFVHQIAHLANLIRDGKTESDLNPLSLTLDFAEKADLILKKKDPKQPTKFTREELQAHEETLRFESFTAKEAMELAEKLQTLSAQDGNKIAIQIELNGFEVYRSMPEGTNRYNDLWMQKKKNTVRLMNKSTMRLWTDMAAFGFKRPAEMTPSGELVFCGGGFPILLKDGSQIGVIAVSGPAGDEYEHGIVVRALEEMLK